MTPPLKNGQLVVKGPIKNEQILVEAPDLRIYLIFCADCGEDTMSEDDALSEISCEKCGCKSVRIIRNKSMEKLLLMKGSKQ